MAQWVLGRDSEETKESPFHLYLPLKSEEAV